MGDSLTTPRSSKTSEHHRDAYHCDAEMPCDLGDGYSLRPGEQNECLPRGNRTCPFRVLRDRDLRDI